ncbi:hypothetical protein Q3G72_033398 [Acer saccharum]|nr:hypothetical protein Q3G72_033398 [Acer saccharum]
MGVCFLFWSCLAGVRVSISDAIFWSLGSSLEGMAYSFVFVLRLRFWSCASRCLVPWWFVGGLGRLGHVAVKISKAFGLKVTVISTSPKKESEAIDILGVDSFLVSIDPAKFKATIGTMDYIIDTIAAAHALAPLLSLLNVNRKLVTVGLPEKPLELPIFPLIIGGSNVGGIKETQEMLDFCSKHNITADIELIRIDELNEAMERLAKSDVKYWFVIDVGNSLSK